MKISKIKIENFRSIKAASFNCNDLNLFVGQNNAGKTNLFEAIDWFYSFKGDMSELSFNRDVQNKVLVEITFSDAQDGVDKMRNEKNQTSIRNILQDSNEITIIRSSLDVKKRTVFVNGEERKPGTGFDSALNDFLPKLEYINTKQYYDSVAKYDKKTPIGIMLNDVLTTILESNTQYLEFQKKFSELFEKDDSEIKLEFENLGNKVKIHLEKQFPDCTKVKFEVTPPIFDDLLRKFNTSIDDGIETSAEEKGDGMQRALMLAIIQAYADFRKSREDVGKSFIFLIDEAELHLHPSAQRKLKNVLLELSNHVDQVFINTHSSVFIVDESISQSIFKVEKENSMTQIELINEYQKSHIVYELLGGSPGDLLLPNNFIIVEGPSEVELITRVLVRFYKEKPKIQIIPARGDTDQTERTINAIEKVFAPLDKTLFRDKVIILCDKPSIEREASIKQFLEMYKDLLKNDQILFLDFGSLEESYPNITDWKKTSEEVKLMSGKKKRQLAKRVGNEIEQETFEKEMNIIFESLMKAWDKAFK
jgi:predicted ATP-dependent endonuclease of OLD family